MKTERAVQSLGCVPTGKILYSVFISFCGIEYASVVSETSMVVSVSVIADLGNGNGNGNAR